MKVTVLQDQSLWDIAIQTTGDVSGIFAIAELNDLEITEQLKPGQILIVPDRAENDRVVKIYKADKLIPATEIDRNFIVEGIEIWGIEIDFEVS